MSSVQSSHNHDPSTRFLVASGVARFAGVMLAVIAGFEVLQGIAAIANDSIFVKGVNYTYELDVTAWGWIHLCIGVVSLAIGIAIATGRTVGYLGGIAVAFLSAVASFAFLPYYPFWSLCIIVFDVLVIWALCVQISGERVDDDFYVRQEGGVDLTTSPEAGGPAESGHPEAVDPPPVPR